MKAMILAAGLGQRMRPLTAITPKPLLSVGQHRLIEYHLFALAKAGIKEVIINVSYFPEQFQQILGDGSRYGLNIYYSLEPSQQPLETGGGILQALPLLGDGPFIALSADLWTDFPFAELPQQINGLAHLVLVPNPPHHPTGDFCLREGKVFFAGSEKWNFGGIAIYHPQLFADCKPGAFPIVKPLSSAITAEKVTGQIYQGEWVNVGTIAQLAELESKIGARSE